MEIITLWEIARDYGAYGILAILSMLLWKKNEKKDKQIYDMLGITHEVMKHNEQISKQLDKISDLLIQLLVKNDKK
jgi:drug/metabolite transporter superfamily protein YnfA